MATAVKPKRSLSETLRPVPGDRRPGAELQPGHARRDRHCCRCCTFRRTRSAGSALVALTAIGLGLIFPAFEAAPGEAVLPHSADFRCGPGKSGFGLGLALGVLYVPCAGPVLAAIVVAGATGTIGLDTVALTLSFAIGAALPLLFFALAGQRVAERVGAFRRHQRRDPHHRRHRDAPVRGRVGVQRARQAAARRSPTTPAGCRNRVGGVGRDPGEAQPRRPGQRPEQGTVELHQRRAPSSKAAAPHRISKASTVG